MSIDLDNLFNDDVASKNEKAAPKPQEATSAAPGTADLVVAPGIELTSKPKAVTAAPKSLAEVYDQYLKRIYLFDVSGSMGEAVVGNETVDMFIWNDRAFEKIGAAIETARREFEKAQAKIVAMATDDEEEEALAGEEANADDEVFASLDELTLKLITAPDPTGDQAADRKALQEWVVQNHLYKALNLNINFSREFKITTRIDLVKTSALNLIKKRFDKYPAADVLAAAFDSRIDWFDYTSKEDLFKQIEEVYPRGGTDIVGALTSALAAIKKSPGVMGTNHIILVTDAEAGGFDAIQALLPRFKEQNVAVDFIHITNPYDTNRSEYFESMATALKQTCEATGGEYTKVTTANEFETKFLEASSRLLLPPGA